MRSELAPANWIDIKETIEGGRSLLERQWTNRNTHYRPRLLRSPIVSPARTGTSLLRPVPVEISCRRLFDAK